MLPKVFFCNECGKYTIHCCKKAEREERVIVYCGMMMPKKVPKEYTCVQCGIKTRE